MTAERVKYLLKMVVRDIFFYFKLSDTHTHTPKCTVDERH